MLMTLKRISLTHKSFFDTHFMIATCHPLEGSVHRVNFSGQLCWQRGC